MANTETELTAANISEMDKIAINSTIWNPRDSVGYSNTVSSADLACSAGSAIFLQVRSPLLNSDLNRSQ